MFGVLLFSSSTFAYTAVEQKALGYGVFRCYNQAREDNSDTVHAVVGEIKLKDVTSYEDIILSNSKDYVPLPTGFSSLHKVTDDNNISCRDLIGGCGDSCFVGLLKKAGVNEHPNNDGEREKLLTILGYTPATSASGRCFKLKNYSMSLGGERISHETVGVCSSSGKSNAADVYIHGSGNDSLDKIEISGDILTMSLWVRNTKADGITGYQRIVYDTKTYNLNNFASFDALSNAMVNDFTDHYVKKPGELYCPITSGTISTTGGDFKQICADGATAREWYDSNNSAKGGIYTIASTRTSDKRALASYKAANNLLGSSFNKVKDIAFAPKEEYDLYKTYFDDYYAATLQCEYGDGASATESSLKSDGYSKIEKGALSGCYAKPARNADKKVYGLNSEKYFDGTELSFEQMIEAYSESAQNADISKEDIENGTDASKVDASSEDTDPCYNAGIEGMSWILCPVINNTTNAVDGIEKILRDWLSIDVNQVFIDQTYSAWTTFRDIANSLLVIVLLIIIFSQLTGVGIDNYGIKKMLPKVVVMAILINLSYIICELAVDLSNILGIGLNNLFEAVGQNIRQGAGAGEETLAGIVAGLFGALAGAGAVAGTAITAISIAGGGGVMLVISLILVLLIALVAVLMFFVMLGARMMIVIMFTVIAPVAFLLYILPNTQALFKKWWKVFQAALVVFPICGALYGLSFVIKAIIFNGGEISFILALIAVCAPFMPFLLIPTLLKSALAGLGIIGGALTMMGNGLKRGISSADSSIKNTNTYKEQQNENARRLQERRANRIVDRLNSRRRNGELSTRNQRRLARNYETLDKLTREDNAARTIMAEQEFKGMTESDIQREWEEAFNAGNTQRLDAVTNVLNARYGTGAANWMAKTLAGKNIAGEGEEQKKMQASMRALQDNMAHNNTFANNMKNKASDAYQMISNGGLLGHDENGKDVFANLDHYSKNNAISKDVKDWSTQSADTLRRAIDSGALEDDTIRQLLSSTDPAIQSGIQSDKGKRDVLQAYLDGMETNPSGVGPSLPEKEAAQRYRDRRQQALDQARNTNEQQRQELVDTLREINENLRQHNQGDTFNGDGDGI